MNVRVATVAILTAGLALAGSGVSSADDVPGIHAIVPDDYRWICAAETYEGHDAPEVGVRAPTRRDADSRAYAKWIKSGYRVDPYTIECQPMGLSRDGSPGVRSSVHLASVAI